MSIFKKQYILDGLCCSNCAVSIEKDVRLLDGIKTATVNTETAALSIEFDGDAGDVEKEITCIAVAHDEDIIVKESLS